MEVISDLEWKDFVELNYVSLDVIELIALRIISKHKQTPRELAIYIEHSDRIENKIKRLLREKL